MFRATDLDEITEFNKEFEAFPFLIIRDLLGMGESESSREFGEKVRMWRSCRFGGP